MRVLLEDALPYVLAFYLLESLVRVRWGESLFASAGGRFAVLGEGLHPAAFSPWAEVYAAFEPPLEHGANGVRIVDEVTGDTHPVRAPDTVHVQGEKVRCGSAVIHTPAPEAAQEVSRRLRVLAAQETPQSLAAYREIMRTSADLPALRALHQRMRPWRRGLRVAQTVLFLGLFVAIPPGLYRWVEPWPDPMLLAQIVAVAWAAVLFLGWRLLRSAGVDRGRVLATMGLLVLFPPGGAHALAHLTRPLFLRFDPMAVAALALQGEALRRFARERLRRLELSRDAAAFVEERRRAWAGILSEAGLSAGEAIAAPSSSDPSAAGYCPLCSTEYRSGFTTCAECRFPIEPLAGR